jgi:hypothetical protein
MGFKSAFKGLRKSIFITSFVPYNSQLGPCVLSMPLKLLVEWIDLTQNRDSWQAVVNEESNIWVP